MNTQAHDPIYFLLVDDLQENLLALEALLRRDGLVLLKARSGSEALELLLTHEVALAFLDVQMPGMDGFELAELMRSTERTRRVPIMFVTAGQADRQRRFRGYETGAVDFLQKPIEPDILRSKSDVFFDLFRQQQQLARQRDELKFSAEENARLLRESRQNADALRLAQKAGGIGVFNLDIESDMMQVSAEFCRIFGLPESPLIPADHADACGLAEDAEIKSTRESRRTATASLNVEYRIRRASDGMVRWIARRAEFVPDANGKPVRMMGVVHDITDRKQAELNLQESQAHLSLMLESAQDYAIISADPSGSIVSWNTGAEHIFGYTPPEVLGQHISVIFTPEDRAAGAPAYELGQATLNGRANDERWHIRKNGERFYASGILAAMRDDGHNVKGFIKIARDMTRQQEAQEALIDARNAAEAANIAKTEFLANMSHEIRTPMNAVIGLSNILATSQPLTQKQTDYIRTLQMSADSLLALINDLLDIAKIEARTVELEQVTFNITQIVQEIISMMSVRVREKGLSFTFERDCGTPRLYVGDPTRLRQIILNLCSNAIKFTESGGVHIEIVCRPASDPSHEEICVAVKDTGIGIAPDKLATIFHKFVQADTSINRKYGGTGLGLAITKTLAEIMGGTIEVESAPGVGSTFVLRLSLPFATDEEVAERDLSLEHVMETSIPIPTRPNVLLVEDYAANILVATTFLEQYGYNVDVAENGLEALDRIKGNPGKYALALMDVQMHGMNGLEATRLIRGLEAQNGTPRLPIIGMTAHALAGDRERCLGVGMDDYIAKPFNPDTLQRLLERYSAEGSVA